MQKEIGGYFELERFYGEEYHKDLVRLNLGRTAVLFLADVLQIKGLWMPYYLCESVTALCEKHGIPMKFYHVDEQMHPIMPEELQENEYLYLVNYYGRFDENQVRSFRDQYKRVILDNTHHFFQRPVEGVSTIYSVRKYFGVSDGAYVSLGSQMPEAMNGNDDPEFEENELNNEKQKIEEVLQNLETDVSGYRMKHILGRFEKDAGTFYQDMLSNAHTYDDEPLKAMSKLTQNLLCGIDYERVKTAREENWKALHEQLKPLNGKVFPMGEGPYVYAFYHENGMDLRRKMAKQKVFVPTNWSNILQNMPQNTLEYDFASNILPIPCDQRYDTEDMKHVADVLRACL